MNLPAGIAAHELLAWAVGLTVTLTLTDLGGGLLRDHPPLGRRWGGTVAGGMGVLSVLLLFVSGLPWLIPLVAVPFGLFAGCYGWAWMNRAAAVPRRALGRDASLCGMVALFLVMLTENSTAGSSFSMVAYATSAALLGGLTCIWLEVVGGRSPLVKSEGPEEVSMQAVLAGLLMAFLGVLDLTLGISGVHMPSAGRLALWAVLSLATPLLLTLAGHKLSARWQTPIWTAALASAAWGQTLVHVLVLK